MNNNKEGISYEANIKYLVEKSNKRAWIIAFIATFFSIIMLALLFYILPLKQTIPYVVKVDKSTGNVELLTGLTSKKYSYNEAIDKYFTSNYVKKREAYYYDLIAQDYIYIQLLSSEKVAKEYRALYMGDNARDKKLTDKMEVETKILSVVLGESSGTKTATVRVHIKEIKTRSSTIQKQYIRVITLAYEYYPQIEMNEDERLQNPLGFKVLTYRIDREVAEDDKTL